MSTIQDTDLFLVERGGVSYKITGEDLKDEIGSGSKPGLAVGKGAITPTLNVEVGDTLTGSATVTEAVNPVEVHVWELNGSEAQRGSSATYTTTADGSVRYRKEVTDDNTGSAVIGAWSDAVTVDCGRRPDQTERHDERSAV